MNDSSRKNSSTVGRNPIKRDPMGAAMGLLSKFAGSSFAARNNLNPKIERVAYEATKTGFKTLGAATRVFQKATGSGKANRLPTSGSKGSDLIDLSPTEDQQLIVDSVKEFATEIIRPLAHDANEATALPEGLLDQTAELGVTLINISDEFEGIATDRGTVTNALVAEALSYGDMGLAVAILAPAGVAKTLTRFGSSEQQRTYLPGFAGEHVPSAVVALAEPHVLADPLRPHTVAHREGSTVVIDGVKSLVPMAGSSEVFIVSADLDGVPTLIIVESDTKGLVVEADPSMGLRAAELGRITLNSVRVPSTNILGGPALAQQDTTAITRDVIRLSRLGWAALAAGTSQAILDYTIPYVNEREAFGEPISHRQSVAFMVANIAIELEGLRLVTLRGASRADQGLSFAREAALARQLTTDKGMTMGLDGVQLLGGHGYTKEHPVERWYRDIRAAGFAEGIVVL